MYTVYLTFHLRKHPHVNVHCVFDVLTDLRLKRNHQPHQIAQKWDELCVLYTDAKMDDIQEG